MTPVYLHLAPGAEPPPLPFKAFRAVIVADVAVSREWRDQIAAWLVHSGCLYAVAWGIECEEWHDAIDWSVLEDFDYGEIPDDRFVMTTWHASEPLSEAFWFAGQCAYHPDVELDGTLIVHVARSSNEQALLASFHESQVLDTK